MEVRVPDCLAVLAASFCIELEEKGLAAEYGDPQTAAGHCYDAAYDFAEHCTLDGYSACAVYWAYAGQGGRELAWADPEEAGYVGPPGSAGEVDESCEHMLTFVRLPEGDYAVDFTCAQFGFTDEFPKIMPLDARGIWQREGFRSRRRPRALARRRRGPLPGRRRRSSAGPAPGCSCRASLP